MDSLSWFWKGKKNSFGLGNREGSVTQGVKEGRKGTIFFFSLGEEVFFSLLPRMKKKVY
jgi:hypothetical protein